MERNSQKQKEGEWKSKRGRERHKMNNVAEN